MAIVSYPPVIQELAREAVAIARGHALHGRVQLGFRRETSEYVVAIVVPAAETVPTRAPTK